MISHLKKIQKLEVRKSIVIIFLIIILTPYLFTKKQEIATSLPEIDSSKKQVISTKSINRKPSKRKTILFWNSYWEEKYFEMGVGNREFKSCPKFNNCYTTRRKSKLTDENEIIDAIVFHGVVSDHDISQIEMLRKKRKFLPDLNMGIEPLFVLFMLVSTAFM